MVRRHGITLFLPLLLALVLIATPFFFIFPLFKSGPAGVVAFLIVILVGVLIATRSFIMWDGDMLIVTTRRVVDVDQEGMFARTVNEIGYENIQDVSWSQKNPVDIVLNVGTVRVRTSSGSLTIEDHWLPHPKDIQQLTNDLAHDIKPKRTDIPPERAALLKDLTGRLEKLDEKTLQTVVQTLRKDDRDVSIKRLFGDDPKGWKPIPESDTLDQK